MLAVPYRAKDTPATRAEFSHTDATMILTFLTYYYRGLSDAEMLANFRSLLRSDNVQEEYDCWTHGITKLPTKFKQLTGVNHRDLGQYSQILFPYLCHTKGTIDFYLSHLVFPKAMKEFPHKISASGWDIAREKCYHTTGFSGTNGSRYILPLSTTQFELPEQVHTNAMQLECLMRPENSFHYISTASCSGSLDAKSLLRSIAKCKPPVRVILDVGAQVLELQNKEVAQKCIHNSEAQAAIFFYRYERVVCLKPRRDCGIIADLPFAKQMDQCLVYLDEAHTRGIDLKLPARY